MSLTATTAADWDALARMRDRPQPLDISPAAADARHNAFGHDDRAIPQGSYCYTPIDREISETYGPRIRMALCPFWAAHPDMPNQQYGYCARLKAGDWEPNGPILLWDQVKECGVNDDPDDEEVA